MYAFFLPMRSPTLLLMRMNAAETSASSAIADCTPLAVVPRSCTTAEIDTFISDVSTTSTNIAIAKSNARKELPVPSTGVPVPESVVTDALQIPPRAATNLQAELYSDLGGSLMYRAERRVAVHAHIRDLAADALMAVGSRCC